MDALYLEYLLKTKGLSREDLAKKMKWSSSTCQRRLSGVTDWTVGELRTLIDLGFSSEEVAKAFALYFFN